MPRHPDHGGGAYTIPLMVKMNVQGLAILDQLRGSTPRSTYLRGLLRAEYARRSTR